MNVNGLLFQFGDNIKTRANSEYSFAIGNLIEIVGTVNKDVFALGNKIEIAEPAEIGGSFYAAGNNVEINSDINGDIAIFARELSIADNIKISGQANLYVEQVNFGEQVSIAGDIIYNEDADLKGYSNIAHGGKLESYIETTYEPDIAEILLQKLFSTIALIIIIIVMLLLFPKIYPKIKTIFTNSSEIVKSGVIGLGILVGTPVASILLLFTVIGVPISLLLLTIYGIMIYLAQAFTGIWLGHLITTGLIKTKTNPYVEALAGIVVLAILSLVPYFGSVIGFFSLLIGLGIIFYAAKGKQDA